MDAEPKTLATPAPQIVSWTRHSGLPGARDAIREIFYEASGTKHFDTDAARAAFEERWLGRYLEHDPELFYLAIGPDGSVAGYLAGALDDPARTARFADIGYFDRLADLTRRFPAHLHINLSPRFRSRGWGRLLIEAFAGEAARAGAPGMHVVTGRGVRNVRFYAANGFEERGSFDWNGRELVFLGRDLPGDRRGEAGEPR